MSHTATSPTTFFTVPDMARELGFTAPAVYKAIDRLGIAAAGETASGISLYDGAALLKLQQDMDIKRREDRVRKRP